MGVTWKRSFATRELHLMRPIAPARAFLPVAAVMALGGAIMLSRARYVESCWVPTLNRMFGKHCVLAYMYNHRIDLVACAYIATAFFTLTWFALRKCEQKVR
jgi:hypothetical protein